MIEGLIGVVVGGVAVRAMYETEGGRKWAHRINRAVRKLKQVVRPN